MFVIIVIYVIYVFYTSQGSVDMDL